MEFKKIEIAKKIGRNGSVTINDERLAKIISKEDWQIVEENIEKYNNAIENNRAEKTIKTYLNKIKASMQKNKMDAAKTIAAKKAAKESIEKKASKTKGKINPVIKAVKEGKTAKEVATVSKSSPKPSTSTGRRYGGEY